jgi:hypothetical protein
MAAWSPPEPPWAIHLCALIILLYLVRRLASAADL